MPFNPLEAIKAEDRLAFSENFDVKRPTALDTVFPDVKTQNLKAEYLRLMDGANLPDIAFVHAFDTEAEIGQRVGFEKVSIEKFLIKRKINQSEKLQQLLENGVSEYPELTKYVYDDATNLFEGVLARTKLMKAQALCRGKILVKENGVDMTVDLGVPANNKINFTKWSDATNADIMGDVQKAVAAADDKGYTINHMMTSGKVIGYLQASKQLQNAILGTNNARLLTKQEIANFFKNQWEIVIDKCDEKYRLKKADGTYEQHRYFDEDAVSFYEAEADGSIGKGLWGVTPEELEYRQFIEKTNRSFITLSMWATPDPVAKWTKASGVFVPVTRKTSGIVIGKLAK